MSFALAERRMQRVTTLLAVFVNCTSSLHFLRPLAPSIAGPRSTNTRTYFEQGPPLSSLRLADGRFHVDVSYPARPVLIFALHLLPSLVWSVIAPLQFSTGLRKHRPLLHRRLGYVFFAISALLAVSGMVMIATPHFTYSLPGRTQLHFGFLPSFDVALTLVSIAFAASMVVALYAARNRSFHTHRLATLTHVGIGLTVHFQRVLMYTQFACIRLLATYAPHTFQRLFRISPVWTSSATRAINKMELDAFVLTGYGGAFLAFRVTVYALQPIVLKKTKEA